MRSIVHFYSELTSNHNRVFVITSFCYHVEFGRLLLLKYAIYSLLFTFTFSHLADAFIQSDLQLGNT